MISLDVIREFVRQVVGAGEDSERGDVPGWVLITLMTAALVAVIWTTAQDSLLALFEQAMTRFSGR